MPTVTRNGAEIYLEMIFHLGLYHADPHPGNLLVMPDGAIGLLDFGMVARIEQSLREDFEDMLLAGAFEHFPNDTGAVVTWKIALNDAEARELHQFDPVGGN